MRQFVHPVIHPSRKELACWEHWPSAQTRSSCSTLFPCALINYHSSQLNCAMNVEYLVERILAHHSEYKFSPTAFLVGS